MTCSTTYKLATAWPAACYAHPVVLQVAAEWRAAGREWLPVAAGREADAMAATRAAISGPVLLVLDYAETRAGTEDLLRAVLDDRGRVRLLASAGRAVAGCEHRADTAGNLVMR